MKTAVIGVGTEILTGHISDTNSTYIERRLTALGHDVMYQFCVGDDSSRLEHILKVVSDECDLVILSGGLGPTDDDITKETVAEYLGCELKYYEEYLMKFEKQAAVTGRKNPENNKKMALLPVDCRVFPNHAGMAPGFAVESGEKRYVCLPGPPEEMKDVFETGALPYIGGIAEKNVVEKNLGIFGMGESGVENALKEVIRNSRDTYIATYAGDSFVQVRITGADVDEEKARQAVDEAAEKVKGILGEYVFCEDGRELWRVACQELIDRKITFSCAESCTAGMLAGAVANMPGISAVFDRGIVTYSPRAKMEELGVAGETIEKYGTVSPLTAREMAAGLAKVSGSRLCLSVTGVAGPDPSEGKPVGLFYVGVAFDGDVYSLRFFRPRENRAKARQYITMTLLDCIRRAALGLEQLGTRDDGDGFEGI